MSMLNPEQIQASKQFIFRNGRLLERQLAEYFFGDGTKQACIKALIAYQNEDGGFGNGIEPDLLCPDSTAIGAETAMFYLEMLEYYDAELVDLLVEWIVANQTEDGVIPHPPSGLFDYPHQRWWTNPDAGRVLVLAGILKKWGLGHDEFFRKVRLYYLQTEPPTTVSLYDYEHFIYLKYCSESDEDRTRLAAIVEQLPFMLEKQAKHFPLFSRAWCHAADLVETDVLLEGARVFIDAIQADGAVDAPHSELPWWRPIATLDGLILLRRLSLL